MSNGVIISILAGLAATSIMSLVWPRGVEEIQRADKVRADQERCVRRWVKESRPNEIPAERHHLERYRIER